MLNIEGNEHKVDVSTASRIDPLAIATLVGIMLMIAMSLWNVWNLNRLAVRVATLEGARGPRPSPGPDPTRIYDLKIEGAATKGAEVAPVTIVEFSDFQCPYCARVVPTLKQVEATYEGKVRIVWKHLPLPIHKDAIGAALAAEAAGNQGKFWEFHDLLFANQAKLGADDLKQYARDLHLDMSRFEADLLNGNEKKAIDADMAEASALNINGTPGFFINGRFMQGAQPFEAFAKVIDEELSKRNVQSLRSASSN